MSSTSAGLPESLEADKRRHVAAVDPPESDLPPPLEITSLGRILWRRKWLILACGIIFAGLAGLVVSQMTPQYSGVASVRVGVPAANVTKIEPIISERDADQQHVASESLVLQSRSVAEQVVKRLALDKLPEFNPALRKDDRSWLSYLDVRRYLKELTRPSEQPSGQAQNQGDDTAAPTPEERRLQRVVSVLLTKIEVTPLGRSQVIEVKASSQDPFLAARIANTFGEVYIEEHLTRQAMTTKEAGKWLQTHIAELREEVEAAESRVEEYRRESGLVESKSLTVSGQQMGELNSQLVIAQAEKAGVEARLNQAESLIDSESGWETAPAVLQSSLINALKQQQAEVEQRAAELSTRYGPKHPLRNSVAAELADIKAKIRSEIQNIIAGLRNEASAAQARYDALSSSLNSIRREVGQSNQASIQLRALEREAEAQRMLFQSFLQRLTETNAQMDLQRENARIISRAVMPDSPNFPPAELILFVGLLGGLLIGGLVAVFVDNLDSTFRSIDDVDRVIRMPTLALVPKLNRHAYIQNRDLNRVNSSYSEAIRKLYISLSLFKYDHDAKVVMITSAVPDEGKSGVGLSLARMAAKNGSRVIVLDCDWRRPTLGTVTGQPNQPGLVQLLAGHSYPQDVVFEDESGAHLIARGPVARAQQHLLTSERMRYLLDSLVRHYDLVLLDTPPVLAGADVLHLARLAHTTIFAVRWGHTPRRLAVRGLQELRRFSGRVAGIVLTQVDTKRYRRYGYGPVDYSYAREK